MTTGSEKIGLDFAKLGRFRRYDVLDDMEAVAHFYNNRGYEQAERSRERGEAPDWGEAERQFRLAVVAKPTFARGWNNLGIAVSRQGRSTEAATHYRKAASLDPLLAAPHANLGALLLQSGDLSGALEELNAAAALESQGSAHPVQSWRWPGCAAATGAAPWRHCSAPSPCTPATQARRRSWSS